MVQNAPANADTALFDTAMFLSLSPFFPVHPTRNNKGRKTISTIPEKQ